MQTTNAYANYLREHGAGEDEIARIVAESDRVSRPLDAMQCPNCGAPSTRAVDPRQTHTFGRRGMWVNYRCTRGCGFLVDRVEDVEQYRPAGVPTVPVQASLDPAQLAAFMAAAGRLQASIDQANRLAAQNVPGAVAAATRGAAAAERGVSLVPGLTDAVDNAGGGLSSLGGATSGATSTARNIAAVGVGTLGALFLGWVYVKSK